MESKEKRKIIIKTVLITLIAVVVLFIAFLIFSSVKSNIRLRHTQENMLNALVADPIAAEVRDKSGKDITEDFFEEYTEYIENGEYDFVLKAIKENGYIYSMRETPRNREYLSKNKPKVMN